MNCRTGTFEVAFALMMVGIVAACEQVDVPANSVPTAPAIQVDEINHTITLTDPAHPSTPVVIRVDTSSQTEYIECGDFHVINGPSWFAEFTSHDYLEVSYEDVGNDRSLERYFFNGRVLELEIDNLNGPSRDQVEKFLEFLPTDPGINTLADHPDGRLMADVFTRAQAGLAVFLQAANETGDYTGDQGKAKLPDMQLLRPDWREWIKRGCALAGVCSGIACRFFQANPVCELCGGTALACAIVMLVNWGGFWR